MKADFLKLDHMVVGFISGIVIPVIVMHFWLQHYSNLSLIEILYSDFFSPIVDTLKSSLFINLGIFFGFYFFKKDKSARGVVFATLVYAAFYIYYKFFL